MMLGFKKDGRQYAPTNNNTLMEDQGEVEWGAADEQDSIYWLFGDETTWRDNATISPRAIIYSVNERAY